MLIYGKNPIYEAIRSGQKIDKLFLLRKKLNTYNSIITEAKNHKIGIEIVDDIFFQRKLKNSLHQGIAAVIKSIRTVLYNLDFDKIEFLVIADSITDPMNLGSIVRSSLLFNAEGIIIPEHNSSGITSAVIKSSSGAVFHQKIFMVKNLRNAIKRLKSEGFWIYGLDMGNNLLIHNAKIEKSDRVAIIIGSEGKGMHRIVKESCDFIVSIPTTEIIDSLNASTAASIAMWEIYKKKFLSS